MMLMRCKWLLIIFCLSSGSLAALDPDKAITQYVHNLWQIEQGLPQNSVYAILQSKDGYLWIGTEEGLARFDGVRFVTYDKHNTPAIKNNWIRALYESRDGTLWIGTDGGGVVALNKNHFKALNADNGLSSNFIKAITEDSTGALWIGTGKGLNRYAGGKFTIYTVKDGLTNDYIRALGADRNGNVWIGTIGGGLNRYNKGKFTAYETNSRVGVLDVRPDGELWIGTGGGGVSRLLNGNFTTFSTAQGLSNDSIFAIAADGPSTWVGTDGGGLDFIHGGKISHYTAAAGLSSDRVLSLYMDREGSLWIGTDRGLNRLYEGKFTSFAAAEGMQKDLVLAVSQDREGHMWFGTDGGGVYSLQNGAFTKLTTKNGLSDDAILSILGGQNALWIGTYSGGLNRISNGKITIMDSDQGLPNDTIYSLYEDRAGDLWIGTFQGLSRVSHGAITTFTSENGLSDDAIRCLIQDHAGALWIGTDHGLNRFSNGKITSYTSKDGLSDDWILSFHEDSNGNLWIGTSGGLNRYRNGKFTSYTTKDGLFHDVVFAILEDDQHNLWMSCNKGVYRVNRKDLDDYDRKLIARIPSISYGTADGMRSSECNGGSQSPAWKSNDGKLWFATMRGVSMIDPARLRTNKLAPPVQVEDFLVDDHSVFGRSSELDPGKEKFEFHYTALSLLNPAKVLFQYKLDGLDRDWVEADTRRTAYYTNIPPGKYTFRVRASNNDGVWNEAGAAIPFTLKPYFYQTLWFYALCAAAAMLAAFGLHRLRVRQLNRQFAAILAERTRISREFHDTVAQGITGVVFQLEAADCTFEDDSASSHKRVLQATELARQTLLEARRSVQNLRAPALENTDFPAAFSDALREIVTEVQVSGTPFPIEAGKQDHLLRIAQEASRNALRHGHADHVIVKLEFDTRIVRLEIIDNGKGFDPDSAASTREGHFGLTGMRERVDSMHGTFHLASDPSTGTHIRIEIPR